VHPVAEGVHGGAGRPFGGDDLLAVHGAGAVDDDDLGGGQRPAAGRARAGGRGSGARGDGDDGVHLGAADGKVGVLVHVHPEAGRAAGRCVHGTSSGTLITTTVMLSRPPASRANRTPARAAPIGSVCAPGSTAASPSGSGA